MKTPVVALDAISLVLASTTMTSALAGALAVVQLRAGGDAPARGRSLCRRSLRGRSPRVALRRSGADVERWTATRCPGAALAAL
ncbi:MAG TPA: hypothetical protein VL242_38895 [Sorangium sp.]|nr:hypothetical protein [Sorangium sp.]